MHDQLYQHQEALSDADLRRYAERIGLDLDRFDGEMESRRWADRVQEQFMGGVRGGVNGTPTFFINGTRHDGSWQEDQLIQALERAAES